MRIVAVFVLSLLLVVGAVWAGLDPSPFRANQLDAIAYELNSIEARINAVLTIPPDDIIPDPNGLVGLLGAASGQLGSLYDRVNAVLSIPPDPVIPVDALTNVRDAAQGIVDRVSAVLSIPPDPYIPVENLLVVQSDAQAIVDLADFYLGGPFPA